MITTTTTTTTTPTILFYVTGGDRWPDALQKNNEDGYRRGTVVLGVQRGGVPAT